MKEDFEIYIESKRIFQGASMNFDIHEWMSNSSEFLSLLPKAEVSQGRRTWGAGGATAPPLCKVGGQCPPILSSNI